MTVHQTAHIWWTLWQLCGTFSAWQSLRGNQVNGNELDEADYRFLASPERTCRLSLFFIRTSSCIIQPIAILQLLSSCQEDRKEQTINSRQGSIGRNQNAHCVGGGYQMTHSRTSPPQSRDLSIWPEPGKKMTKRWTLHALTGCRPHSRSSICLWSWQVIQCDLTSEWPSKGYRIKRIESRVNFLGNSVILRENLWFHMERVSLKLIPFCSCWCVLLNVFWVQVYWITRLTANSRKYNFHKLGYVT